MLHICNQQFLSKNFTLSSQIQIVIKFLRNLYVNLFLDQSRVVYRHSHSYLVGSCLHRRHSVCIQDFPAGKRVQETLQRHKII